MVDNTIPLLPRQTGLLDSARAIANNIANASTPGFKAEGTVFAEYVALAGAGGPSLSMGELVAQTTDFTPGAMKTTGGTFDFALAGEGFFKVQTPAGDRLTRAGVFSLDPDGILVDMAGNQVADDGGAPIQIPPDAVEINVARDGTISVDGEIFGFLGVYVPDGQVVREGSNLWRSVDGDRLLEEPQVIQGAVEQSNVDPVLEFAKLISTQREFEAGQTLTEQEHQRLSELIDAIRTGG